MEAKPILELITTGSFDKIFHSFEAATDLKTIIVDKNGNDLREKESFYCRFCSDIRKTGKGCKYCRGSYARAGNEAAKYGEPYIFRCHAGLIAIAVPVIVKEESICTIICGQILMWEPDEFLVEEIITMTDELNLDYDTVMTELQEMQIVSAHKVQAAANMLFVITNQILEAQNTVFHQRQEIANHQAQINKEIRTNKDLRRKQDKNSIYGSYQSRYETELIRYIRLGDKKQIHQAIGPYIANLIENYATDINVFRMKIITFLISLPKEFTANRSGYEESLVVCSNYIHKLYSQNTIDGLCEYIYLIAYEFMNFTADRSNLKDWITVESATQFIRQNYMKKLTLQEIADSIYISKYYLCHLFQSVLDISVVNYINMVRIEYSKKFLYNPKLSVGQVAEKVGFENLSYFCKIFKKHTGTTPSEYRKKLI